VRRPKSLAIEYAKRGIRVNAIAPGIIKTPMHAVETYEQLAKMHPLGGWARSPTSSARSLYLESAGFVTGDTIPRRRQSEVRATNEMRGRRLRTSSCRWSVQPSGDAKYRRHHSPIGSR